MGYMYHCRYSCSAVIDSICKVIWVNTAIGLVSYGGTVKFMNCNNMAG